MNKIVICIFLAALFISGYNCRSGVKNAKNAEVFHQRDSGWLFDGNITQWMGDHEFRHLRAMLTFRVTRSSSEWVTVARE